MRVRFLKKWSDYPPGAETDIPDHLALAIIVEAIATVIETQPITAAASSEPEPESAVVAPGETAVMPTPAPRRRGRRPKPPEAVPHDA